MRRAARRDANEHRIIDALTSIGCLVQQLSAAGVPDLLVMTPSGRLVLVEVKDGSKPPSARRLTSEQKAWHSRWSRAPLAVVASVDDVVALCNTWV